jgi:hypothetical protein
MEGTLSTPHTSEGVEDDSITNFNVPWHIPNQLAISNFLPIYAHIKIKLTQSESFWHVAGQLQVPELTAMT